MAGVDVRSFSSPDDTQEFPKARFETLSLGADVVARLVLEPGWVFSKHGGAEACEDLHLLYIESGRLRIKMTDGLEAESGPGDIVRVEPGHDAWVVGDEDCVFLDFAYSASG